MKKLFIWWHRRRAQTHAATAANKDFESGVGIIYDSPWNKSWSEWHLKQIERLEKEGEPAKPIGGTP